MPQTDTAYPFRITPGLNRTKRNKSTTIGTQPLQRRSFRRKNIPMVRHENGKHIEIQNLKLNIFRQNRDKMNVQNRFCLKNIGYFIKCMITGRMAMCLFFMTGTTTLCVFVPATFINGCTVILPTSITIAFVRLRKSIDQNILMSTRRTIETTNVHPRQSYSKDEQDKEIQYFGHFLSHLLQKYLLIRNSQNL